MPSGYTSPLAWIQTPKDPTDASAFDVRSLAADTPKSVSIPFGSSTAGQANILHGTFGPAVQRNWRIEHVALKVLTTVADPQFDIVFWHSSAFDDTDLDTDAFLGWANFTSSDDIAWTTANYYYWEDPTFRMNYFDSEAVTTSGFPRLHATLINRTVAGALDAAARAVLVVGLSQVT